MNRDRLIGGFILALVLATGFPVKAFPAQNTPDIPLYEHLARYPRTRAEDLYKLVYQGFLGPGHYGATQEQFLGYLEQEVKSVKGGWEGDTLLVERLPGPFVRINLRPFLAADGDVIALAEAMERSLDYSTDTTWFFTYYKFYLLDNHDFFHLEKMKAELQQLYLMAHQSPQGPPAIHHSDVYRESYRPRYRVIHQREAAKLLEKMGIRYHLPYFEEWSEWPAPVHHPDPTDYTH